MSPSACYRGPKLQKCPKGLGEGAKDVLASWRMISQESLAPFQSHPKGAGKLVPRENCRKVSKICLTLFVDF